MNRPDAIPGLAGRSVLTLENHEPDAVAAVLDLAAALKAERSWPPWLAGRVIALIFERPSTRTRISFQSGIARLGGTALVLSSDDMQMGRGETVGDTARVLSRMVDAVMLRTGAHSVLQELSDNADVPVINGLTYDHHPCQALADAQTLRERFGTLSGLRMTYVGDGNNVLSSLMILAGLTGIELVCSCPEGYLPDDELLVRSDRSGTGAWRLGAAASAIRSGPSPTRGPSTPTPGFPWVTSSRRPSAWPTLIPIALMPTCSPQRPPMPLCSTACPPTMATRSRPMCSTVRAPQCGIRRRIACMRRPHSWFTCWPSRSP